MKSSSIAILAAGAVGLAAVAGLVITKRGEKPEQAAGKLFPNLAGKINDAARVEILKGGQQTTLVKDAQGAWSVESNGGYPAEFETIKSLIVGLSKSEIQEEKTSNPENYARIGVEDPKPAASKAAEPGKDAPPTPEAPGSTEVTLKDSGGQTLAAVILGNTPPAAGMGGEAARFARRAGEKQSYLVKPAPSAEPGIMTWVNREVMKIDGVRIQTVRIHSEKPLETPAAPTTDPNVEPPSTLAAPALPQDVLIERSAPTAQDALGKLEFKNLPTGREVKNAGQDGQIATAIAYLDMEDVAPAAKVADAPVVTTAEYRTKDGLAITLTTREKDGKTWGTIQASAFAVLPPAKAEEKPADAAPAKDGEKKDEAKPAEAQAGPAVPVIDPKIEDEAKKLNEKLGKWAFAIPSWKAGLFKSNWKELLKDPAQPSKPAGPTPEGMPLPMPPQSPPGGGPG